MARPVSSKVQAIQRELRDRIAGGHYHPGEAIPSARALARRHGVCYQTAHRILTGLAEEGLLEKRHGSGTRVAGAVDLPSGVLLCFHPRARRAGSFGAHLKGLLEAALVREGVDFRTAWTSGGAARHRNLMPVYWEPTPGEQEAERLDNGYALILNDRRVYGLESSRVDTIATDDFSGGACAAELVLRQAKGAKRGTVVLLAARGDDPRSADRVAGFRSVLPVPDKHVIVAGSWERQDGVRVAPAVWDLDPVAVFCCNDRLAEGLMSHARQHDRDLPALVGFDNAPVAERLGLTTVGVPWEEMIAAAVDIIQRRLRGDRGVARRQIFAPHPVIRSLAGGPVNKLVPSPFHA